MKPCRHFCKKYVNKDLLFVRNQASHVHLGKACRYVVCNPSQVSSGFATQASRYVAGPEWVGFQRLLPD